MVKLLLMPVLLLATTTLSLGACCCGVPTDPAEGKFTAEAAGGELILRNQSEQTIHYFAVEEETAARVDLDFEPRNWPAVPPAGEARVQYAAIAGYVPGAQRALVHWWSEQGGYRTPLEVELR